MQIGGRLLKATQRGATIEPLEQALEFRWRVVEALKVCLRSSARRPRVVTADLVPHAQKPQTPARDQLGTLPHRARGAPDRRGARDAGPSARTYLGGGADRARDARRR